MNEQKENKMGTMPVGKLIVNISLPLMVSMLAQALYNVVDSLFVSRISENALTAVSIAFPIQNLMIAIAVGTGVGINAFLSKSLGEKNKENVDLAANNGIFLAFVSYIVFMSFTLFLSSFYFKSQTDISEIVTDGEIYIRICALGCIGVFMQITLGRLLQSTGKAVFAMLTQFTGALINIIFDPILIFGLFGFPKLGMAGAAIATLMGQIFGTIIALYFNLKFNNEITLKIKGFRPDIKTIKRIYSVGFPAIVMQAVSSVMIFGMNNILLSFSSTATAVFGIYFKLQSFIVLPVIGLNNGIVPIIAFNYGARHKERIIKTIKISILSAFIITFMGMVIFHTFPGQILELFKASENMLKIGIPALKTMSLCFIFASFSIVMIAVFQAFSKGFYSLWVSLLRQMFVLLPVAYLFSKSGNINLVWWAFPIGEIASLLLAIVLLKRLYREKIINMPD
ncbi:MAG: MATE family efflux transporter [Clostridia bacterium]|jgi:putative MATE family efflux protein|nr:MATE family efflux transporter [Clostridia bacterium]MCI2000952.1 MATE family efflux transporter [Clostridia bacterium]MCI2015736.1 MATE family efflux transporter [Clostridia bacterium]